MKRIAVFGKLGGGKSTLRKQLAKLRFSMLTLPQMGCTPFSPLLGVGLKQERNLTMKSSDANFKSWITAITVIAPVVSAIIVAVIAQQTNLRLGELDSAGKAASLELEVSKLKDQQEARRLQFLEKHLPQILSNNESEQLIGKALLFTTYPSEAFDILASVVPEVRNSTKKQLENIKLEAQEIKKATGDWSIVISGDKTLDLAEKWLVGAEKLKYTPATIYKRDDIYRVTVGNYTTRDVAEQNAIRIRPKTRSDAYVVALGRWCPSPNRMSEDSVEILECDKM